MRIFASEPILVQYLIKVNCMIGITSVAAYILQEYKKRKGEDIDEMKLHKLLYFAQRESYVVNEAPLFNGSFVAAPFGPMSLVVRRNFKNGNLFNHSGLSGDFLLKNKKVFDMIWSFYAERSSWSLSMISHCEISWRNAIERRQDTRYEKIEEDDIRLDALRVKRLR